MVEVKITEEVRIGGSHPCFIIAEAGQNHQGDIEIAKKLIKAAKVCGHTIATTLFCVFNFDTIVEKVGTFELIWCRYSCDCFK